MERLGSPRGSVDDKEVVGVLNPLDWGATPARRRAASRQQEARTRRIRLVASVVISVVALGGAVTLGYMTGRENAPASPAAPATPGEAGGGAPQFSDAAATLVLNERLSDNVAADGSLAVDTETLLGPSRFEAAATAALLQAGLGTDKLVLQGASVATHVDEAASGASSAGSSMDVGADGSSGSGGPAGKYVDARGTATLFGAPVRANLRAQSSGGRIQVGIELFPAGGMDAGVEAWIKGQVMGLSPAAAAAWPALGPKTALVWANYRGSHVFLDAASAPRPSAAVVPGLNLISTVRAAQHPQTAMLMSALSPTAAGAAAADAATGGGMGGIRRLTASGGSGSAASGAAAGAGAIAAMAGDASGAWYAAIEHAVEGLVRPVPAGGSAGVATAPGQLPTLHVNGNTALTGGAVSYGNSTRASFTGTAVVDLLPGNGFAPLQVDVRGALENDTFTITGNASDVPLGRRAVATGASTGDGLELSFAAVAISASTRGATPPGSAMRTRCRLTGSLTVSGAAATLDVALPIAAGAGGAGHVVLNVSDVRLSHEARLQNALVSLSGAAPHFAFAADLLVLTGIPGPDDAPAMAAAAAAAAAASSSTSSSSSSAAAAAAAPNAVAGAVRVRVAATFGSGQYYLTGQLDEWRMYVGAAHRGLTVRDIRVNVAGLAGRSSAASDFSLALSGTVALPSGLQLSASLALPTPITGKGVTVALALASGAEMSVATAVNEVMGFQGEGAPAGAGLESADAPAGLLQQLTGTGAGSNSGSGSGNGHGVRFVDAAFEVSSSPLTVRATGSVSFGAAGSVADLEVVARRVNCSWGWGAGLSIGQAFKFSDVVKGDASLDHLPFARGAVVIANSNATFTLGSGVGALSVTRGVAFGASLPLSHLSERLVNAGTWPTAEAVTVTGAFAANTHALTFTATLPDNLPLLDGVTLSYGSVLLSNQEPRYALNAAASVAPAPAKAGDKSSSGNGGDSDSPPLTCRLSGTLDTNTYTLSGAVSGWHIGAASKGVTVESASLRLVGARKTPADKFAVTGEVAGTLVFGGAHGVRLQGTLPLPLSLATFSLEVPLVRVNKDVTLYNVTLHVAGAPVGGSGGSGSGAGGASYSLSAVARITTAASSQPLEVDVTGTIAGGEVSITGTVPSWHLGGGKAKGSDGVTMTSVVLALHGKAASPSSSGSASGSASGAAAVTSPLEHVQLSGSLSGSVDFYGTTLAGTVDVPLSADGTLVVSLSDLHLGSHAVLRSLSLTVRPSAAAAAAARYSLAAQATVATGVRALPLNLSVAGTFGAAAWTLDGTMSTWQLSPEFAIDGLNVHLVGTRASAASTGSSSGGSGSGSGSAATTTSLNGVLTGTMDFDGFKVGVEAVLPPAHGGSLTVELPMLRLGRDVRLANVSMTLQQVEPRFKFAGVALVHTALPAPSPPPGLPADELAVSVTGSISKGAFTLSGAMSAWTLPVGHKGFAVRDLTLTLAGRTDEVSGTLAGTLDLDASTSLAMSVELVRAGSAGAAENAEGGVTVRLALAAGQSMTLTRLATATCGADAMSTQSAPMPSDTASQVSTRALEAVAMNITTNPPAVSVDATMSAFGFGGLQARFVASPDASSGVWGFGFGVSVTQAVAFSAFVPSEKAFDDIPFEWGGFVVATGNRSFAMPSTAAGGATDVLRATRGVTVAAMVPMKHLSAKLMASGAWTSVEGVVMQARFGFDTHALTFDGELPPNLPLGKHCTVNGTLHIARAASGGGLSYGLTASAKLELHSQLDPVLMEASIDVGADGRFTLTGYAANYHLRLGKHGMAAAGMALTLTDVPGASGDDSWSGRVTGDVLFADGIVMQLELDLPAPTEASGFEIDLKLAPGATITMGDAITNTAGAQAVSELSMPSEFSDVLSSHLLGAEFRIVSHPFSLLATGKVSIFHMSKQLDFKLVVMPKDSEATFVDPTVSDSDDGGDSSAADGQDSGGNGDGGSGALWLFGFGIAIGENFQIGDVLPSITVVHKEFASGALVVTNMDAGFEFEVPATAAAAAAQGSSSGGAASAQGTLVRVVDGVELAGILPMSGNLAVVQKWTKINDLIVTTSFGFDTHMFTLAATLDVDWHITKRLRVSEASLFMDVGGVAGFDVGLSIDLEAQVGSRAADTLGFEGALMFTPDSLVMSVATLNPWHNPFGIKGVTVGDTEIELGIAYSGEPDLIGFSGSLTVGKVTGSVTVYIDAAQPDNTVLAGSLSYFNLGTLLTTVTDGALPKALATTVFNVGFTDLSLSYNGGLHALHFDGKVFKPGFFFKVGSFVLFGVIKGSAELDIAQRSGIFCNASVDPILIPASTGKILRLSGFDSVKAPASLLIDVGGPGHSNTVKVDAMASVLGGLVHAGAHVDISDAGWLVNVSFSDGILDLDLALRTPSSHKAGSAPSDFELYAGVQLPMLDYLSTKVVGMIKDVKATLDSKMSDAKAKVDDWEAHEKPKIAANEAKIAEYKKADEAKFNSAEQKVADAHAKLVKAQAKVDGLQHSIDKDEADKEHCKHWYDAKCKAHNAWLDTKIAADWTAKHAADAALDIAKGIMDAASKGVEAASKVTANVDPRVLALETENAGIETAGHVATAALTAAQDISDAALSVADWSLKALGSIFNLESAFVRAASMGGVSKGVQIEFGGQGKFLGASAKWDLKIDFPPSADRMLQSIWDDVKHKIGI